MLTSIFQKLVHLLVPSHSSRVEEGLEDLPTADDVRGPHWVHTGVRRRLPCRHHCFSPDTTATLILERLRLHGLKYCPSKCTLVVNRSEYLGHHVSTEGNRPQSIHVHRITVAPVPDYVIDCETTFPATQTSSSRSRTSW